MERFFFERGGVTLSGLRGGRGAGLVVLLHGLAGAAQEMIPTAEALADEYRVVALDLRGHGHSTRVPADLSRQAFVDDVLAVVDEPAVLVGQSMGAQTAMLVAAKATSARPREAAVAFLIARRPPRFGLLILRSGATGSGRGLILK